MEHAPRFEGTLSPEEHEQLSTRYAEILSELARLKSVRDELGETAHHELPYNEDGSVNEGYVDHGITEQIEALEAERATIDEKIANSTQHTAADGRQGELDI